MYVDEITAELDSPITQEQRRPRTNRRKRGCVGRLALLLVLLLLAGGLTVSAVAGTWVYADWSAELDDEITALASARDRETFQTTRIYDRHGVLLWEIFGEGKRTNVTLADIPQELQWATISVEDDTFYENNGLDAPSLVAALIANLRNRGDRPVGASTITQQLVRHLVFDYEERTAVSYDRKAKEIVLAWQMTNEYTKDEILTMYLNEIYYGNLAYGIEAASQTYFGKSALELTLGESALLAALPQSPIELDPLTNLEGAKERQWIVLNLMVEEGYITMEAAENAYIQPLEFVAQEVSLEAPHFAVYVRQLLEAEYGAEMVANGGLRVTTSLDMDYQRLAEALARQHIANIDPAHNLTNTALVALKPGTGEILAMLGSIDYRDETIDGHVNVTLSQQQPGSAIKPLTYAAALAAQKPDGTPAWTAADILWDVEVDFPQFNGESYSPVNYDERFHGPARLREALANSYNIPAIL
ncbi:MAG: transglycosylase domain-containing protein, partial [Anaerolineales bacterium]|nr:transglycosylase domain-containing protein [Anaerolineales bacterium]